VREARGASAGRKGRPTQSLARRARRAEPGCAEAADGRAPRAFKGREPRGDGLAQRAS